MVKRDQNVVFLPFQFHGLKGIQFIPFFLTTFIIELDSLLRLIGLDKYARKSLRNRYTDKSPASPRLLGSVFLILQGTSVSILRIKQQLTELFCQYLIKSYK